MAAMQREVRGFFPTSIPVEVAIAGLRLVLAGGVYRPLPAARGQQDVMPYLAYSASPELPAIHDTNGVKQDAAGKTVSTSRRANNMCSPNCSSAFPTS